MATKKTAIVRKGTADSLSVLERAEVRIDTGIRALANLLSGQQTPEMVAKVAHLINVRLMEPLKNQLDMAKAILKAHVSDVGDPSGKNGQGRFVQLSVGTDTFKVEKRVAVHQVPDMAKYMELLRSKDLNPEDWCKQVVSYEYDPDMLGRLLDEGHITMEEFEACQKKVESLHIEKV